MKTTILCLLASIVLAACNQNQQSADTPDKNAEAKALYEKNLATLQASFTAFENEQIDAWASYVDDQVVWNSPAYGAPVGTKDDYKKALSSYVADWDSLKLENANFLPGLDSTTHELDGSVRYYGQWKGVHKSGVKTSVNIYGSYEFGKDGKVISSTEFFDLGGLMNALTKK